MAIRTPLSAARAQRSVKTFLNGTRLSNAVMPGAEPAKIAYMAEAAVAGRYDQAEIAKGLEVFGRRFITQQFKRSAMPDGAAAGVVSLSPRGGFAMPSDASPTLWKIR